MYDLISVGQRYPQPFFMRGDTLCHTEFLKTSGHQLLIGFPAPLEQEILDAREGDIETFITLKPAAIGLTFRFGQSLTISGDFDVMRFYPDNMHELCIPELQPGQGLAIDLTLVDTHTEEVKVLRSFTLDESLSLIIIGYAKEAVASSPKLRTFSRVNTLPKTQGYGIPVSRGPYTLHYALKTWVESEVRCLIGLYQDLQAAKHYPCVNDKDRAYRRFLHQGLIGLDEAFYQVLAYEQAWQQEGCPTLIPENKATLEQCWATPVEALDASIIERFPWRSFCVAMPKDSFFNGVQVTGFLVNLYPRAQATTLLDRLEDSLYLAEEELEAIGGSKLTVCRDACLRQLRVDSDDPEHADSDWLVSITLLNQGRGSDRETLHTQVIPLNQLHTPFDLDSTSIDPRLKTLHRVPTLYAARLVAGLLEQYRLTYGRCLVNELPKKTRQMKKSLEGKTCKALRL